MLFPLPWWVSTILNHKTRGIPSPYSVVGQAPRETSQRRYLRHSLVLWSLRALCYFHVDGHWPTNSLLVVLEMLCQVMVLGKSHTLSCLQVWDIVCNSEIRVRNCWTEPVTCHLRELRNACKDIKNCCYFYLLFGPCFVILEMLSLCLKASCRAKCLNTVFMII